MSVEAATHLNYSPRQNKSSDKKPDVRYHDWTHGNIILSTRAQNLAGVPIVACQAEKRQDARVFQKSPHGPVEAGLASAVGWPAMHSVCPPYGRRKAQYISVKAERP